MSAERTMPSRRVPILTEVVRLSDGEPVDIPLDEPVGHVVGGGQESGGAAGNEPVGEALSEESEERVVEKIWADLQRQVDLVLDYRMRETLAPILSRATDAVIREARQQLASTLRDMVARAVAQELSRHRAP
jgi:hypothetical protein